MDDPDAPTPQARPAPVDAPIHPLIAGRWSTRAFAPDPVDPALLRSVLEAARWAPSSFNEQPWRFLVGTTEEPEWRERLLGYLSEKNRAWANRAPVVVASAYATRFDRNDRENRMALRDLGAAEENAFLEAFHQGLVMHQMPGFDHARLQEELLPEGFDPGSMWALGHPGEPADVPGERRSAERKRRPLAATVFAARWGKRRRWTPTGSPERGMHRSGSKPPPRFVLLASPPSV